MLWLLVTKDKRLISIFITATCYLEIEYKSIYLNPKLILGAMLNITRSALLLVDTRSFFIKPNPIDVQISFSLDLPGFKNLAGLVAVLPC